MNAVVKSSVESALIALLAAGVCLWFLISGSQQEDPSAARMALLGIGLACALTAHLIFMGVAVKRSGRSLVGWMLAFVLLGPVGTAAFLAVIASEEKPAQT